MASEGGTEDAKRRGDAFARAFSAHLARFASSQHIIKKILLFCFEILPFADNLFWFRLMEEPAAYGKLGLANLLELREECLREFQFVDAYRSIKLRYKT